MAFSDYDELDLIGMHIKNVTWGGERLSVSFGSGYTASAVVGVAHGLHRWRIQGRYVPDNNVLMIGSQTWFDYYYEFYKDHTMGDEETFLIEWRNTHWHVKFADPNISFDAFRRTGGHYEHAQGLELVQVRISGLTYEADGSIDFSIPCPPQNPLTAEETGAYTIEVSWVDPPADCVVDTSEPCPAYNVVVVGVSSGTMEVSWEDGDCSGDNLTGSDTDWVYYL